MRSIVPIGLQLFSVRGEVEKNLAGTLKSLSGLGFVAAEPWGYNGEKLEWMGHSAKDIRAMYDDNGMICCGMHLTTSALMGDNLARTSEMNHILGNRFLVIAADRQRTSSIEGVKELAGILNNAAEKVANRGQFVGYHAHAFDFTDLDGKTGWERLFSSTRKEVIMQMDIGNCANGGGDPIAMLKKFVNRARSLHLKDYGGAPGSVLGEGKADWKTIWEVVEKKQNPEWYVIEEGSEDGLGYEICKRSLAALHKMGK